MSTSPNRGQREVMREPTGELFVSAGAGTGKTYALTRRFVAAADDLDRVLTITFTDKAAGELVERIRGALIADGRVDEARAIDGAWVSTIHGFCRRVLRRYALEAGIDPYFVVLDEVGARALAEECFEAVMVELLDADEGVEALVMAYGLELVRAATMDVHARIRHLGGDATAVATDPPPALPGIRAEALRSVREAAETLTGAKPGKTVDGNREALTDALAALGGDLDDGDAIRVGAEHLGRLRSSSSATIKESTETARLAESLLLGAVAAHAAAGHAEALARLLVGFDTTYADAKADRGALDFEDLQSRALELFETRPDIGERYREHFRAVMVDEFQDTDALQLKVVEQVSGANLCTVGDEFQSIYGFRCADVEVFRGRARDVAAGGDRVRLELNYRSDPAVLAVVNEVFGSDAFFGGRFERLEPGIESAPACELEELPHVHVLITDHRREHAAKARTAEAAALAGYIGRIVEAGRVPSDIVILLRALTEASVYAEALRSVGIGAHVEGGGAFYEQDAVAEARCLLAALANPLDEGALAVVVAGRASRLSPDALHALGSDRGAGESLWGRLGEASALDLGPADAEEAARLHRVIEGLRERAGRSSVSRTLRAAIRETGLREAYAAVAGTADLDKLVRIAEAYQRRDIADLAGFLEHLKVCERHARTEPRALETAPEDAVRIMTVHRAKGLEFPVVVVADLGRPPHGERARALVEPRDGEIALALVAPSEGERAGAGARTPAFTALLEERKAQAAEEGDRVLYVACTRAERMLVLSGATDMSREPRDSTDIDRFRSALGVGASAPGETDLEVGEACVRVAVVDADVAAATGAVPDPDEVSDPTMPIRDAGSPTAEGQPTDPMSPDEAGWDPPATLSFSDLDAYRRCPYRWWLVRQARLPEPVSEGVGARPRPLGTAVHTALEIDADTDLLATIARHEGLDPEGERRLAGAVARFRGSDTARRLAEADRVAREVPFTVPLGETLLVGSIDALAYEQDRALIVDYKTGDPDTLAGEPLSEARELQAVCYAHAARHAGASVVEVVFAYVEHDDAERRITLDAAAIESAVDERLGPLLHGIAEGRLGPRDAYEAALCRTCPGFGGLCPMEA